MLCHSPTSNNLPTKSFVYHVCLRFFSRVRWPQPACRRQRRGVPEKDKKEDQSYEANEKAVVTMKIRTEEKTKERRRSSFLKCNRALTGIRDLRHQHSLFVPKALTLEKMHKLLHKEDQISKSHSMEGKEGRGINVDAAENATGKIAGAAVANRKSVKTFEAKVKALMLSQTWNILIAFTTIFALYGDDFRLLVCPKSADIVFQVLTFLALIIFVGEMIINVAVTKKYLWGFDFWLDLVSTVSLIPDIGFMWDPITGADENDSTPQNAVMQAGRASRAGTRAVRVVRIVRLVRMVRIVKLLQQVRRQKRPTPQVDSGDEHSRVGERLLQVTTRRVIILVLLMVMLLPLFDGGLDSQYNQYQDFGLAELHRMPQDYNFSGQLNAQAFRKSFEEYARNSGKLLYISICEKHCATVWSRSTTDAWLEDLRFRKSGERGDEFTETIDPITGWTFESMHGNLNEIHALYRPAERPRVVASGCYLDCTRQKSDPWSTGPQNMSCEVAAGDYETAYGISNIRYSGCVSIAYFDNRGETQYIAGMSMLKTTFVMLLLACGILAVDRDAQKLVINPIRRMVSLVRRLSEDPLGGPGIDSTGTNGRKKRKEAENVSYFPLYTDSCIK